MKFIEIHLPDISSPKIPAECDDVAEAFAKKTGCFMFFWISHLVFQVICVPKSAALTGSINGQSAEELLIELGLGKFDETRDSQLPLVLSFLLADAQPVLLLFHAFLTWRSLVFACFGHFTGW